MSLLVKICGLREERHVQAAVDAGANAIGFVFADSVRKILPLQAATISRSAPPHIRRVAVMLNPSNAQWLRVLEEFQPDVLQTDAGDFAALEVPDSVERWPVYREGESIPDTDGSYLYEGRKSGSGKTVDWSRAATVARNGQMILAGGLRADSVAAAVATVQPFGIDVSSAVESAPGKKDSQLITKFVFAARAAEKGL